MNIRQLLVAALFVTSTSIAGCTNSGTENPESTTEMPDETQDQTPDQTPEQTSDDQTSDSTNTPGDLLIKNRELWNQSSIAQYTLDYFISCFCQSERVKVSVQDSEIIAVRISNFQGEFIRDVPPSEFGNFLKVEGLFDVIASAIPEADVVKVDYNTEFGYPELIDLDFLESAVDDELRYLIEFSRTE